MNEIVFSPKLVNSTKCKFFAIPVFMIKVILNYREKAELNHFERVILSLLVRDNYSVDQLADFILLDKTLVDLIVHDLETKKYIDDKRKITPEGRKVLENQLEIPNAKVAYVFYDKNRDCLFQNIVNYNDFQTVAGSKNHFTLIGDNYDSNISFTVINKKTNHKKSNEDLENMILKELFKSDIDKKLTSINLVDVDKKERLLIGCARYEDEDGNNVFSIANPFTGDEDTKLYEYFASNLDDKTINGFISELLDKSKEKLIKNKQINSQNYDFIKNKLFNKVIKPNHEYLIDTLSSALKSFNDAESKNKADFVKNNMTIKDSMINLGDLFEDILYEIARKQRNYEGIIRNVKSQDNLYLELDAIARKIGFDGLDSTNTLLKASRKEILHAINKPSKMNLQLGVSLNLLIAKEDRNHCFYKMVEVYPNLLNALYSFKRKFRDKNRHGNEIGIMSPKFYFDIMFKLLELGLGYKVNENKLEEFSKVGEEQNEMEYAKISLISQLGSEIFESDNENAIKLSHLLLYMYSSFINSDPKTISNAYAIYDSTLKMILKYSLVKYDLKYKPLQELYENKKTIIDYLKKTGFIIKDKIVPDSKLEDLITYDGKCKESFETEFKNSVISSELSALIIMMSESEKLTERLLKCKNIFTLATCVTYFNKHQQNHKFNFNVSRHIVDETIEFVNNTKGLFIKGE